VLYQTDDSSFWRDVPATAGAQSARFYTSDVVAVTATEKARLRAASGADAVEMESDVIMARCRKSGIPCATVRVIADPAGEDLPVDFNRLMTTGGALLPLRLLGALVRSPSAVPRLIRLWKQSRNAARNLADVLLRIERQLST
jgi:nucleoside phosphorylase